MYVCLKPSSRRVKGSNTVEIEVSRKVVLPSCWPWLSYIAWLGSTLYCSNIVLSFLGQREMENVEF